jgi:hypothetical protein
MTTKIRTRFNYKNKQRDKAAIKSIWQRARQQFWTHEYILEKLSEICNSDRFKTQPMHAKEYLRGYSDALFDMHWEYLVYTYDCGEHGRLSIESEEYKAIRPYDVHKLYSDSGCHCYRENLSARFN